MTNARRWKGEPLHVRWRDRRSRLAAYQIDVSTKRLTSGRTLDRAGFRRPEANASASMVSLCAAISDPPKRPGRIRPPGWPPPDDRRDRVPRGGEHIQQGTGQIAGALAGPGAESVLQSDSVTDIIDVTGIDSKKSDVDLTLGRDRDQTDGRRPPSESRLAASRARSLASAIIRPSHGSGSRIIAQCGRVFPIHQVLNKIACVSWKRAVGKRVAAHTGH